ncbi:YncE family protein [Streptomyces roseus]|uniref:YncE family protein n=1 Tax=Streptomyces roseus TaxID=66430 RepID=UPI0036B3A164
MSFLLRGSVGPTAHPDGTRAYVTNSASHSVSVVDTTTTPPSVSSVDVVGAGRQPVDVAVSPSGDPAYVTVADIDRDSGTVVAIGIGTTSHTITSTVTVGAGDPAGVAVSPDGGRIDAADQESGTVSLIDATATPPAVTTTITTITVDRASGATVLALTSAGEQAYVTNVDSGNLLAINATAQPPAVFQTIASGGASVGEAGATVPDTTCAQAAVVNARLVLGDEEGGAGISGKTSTTGGAPPTPRLPFPVIGSNSGFVPLARSRSPQALIEHPARVVVPAPARAVSGNPPGAVAPQRRLEALSVHACTDGTLVRGYDTFVLIERAP